jgi:transposase-like protein
METPSKFARRYDAEFKHNAGALVQSGRGIAEVCRDPGCSSWSLGRWVAAAKHGGSQTQPKTLAAQTPEQRENRRLRPENDCVRRQRDILTGTMQLNSGWNGPPARSGG